MSTATLTRRELRFATLDDAVRDAERLLAGGYDRVGHWSLGQVCGHLALWIQYPLDGFPALPVWLRPVAWVLRNTLAPGYKRKLLAGGKIPSGLPAPPATVLPATTADSEGLGFYKTQLDRLRAFRGTPHPSPLLGPVDTADLIRLSCVHAAHHLSFLAPKHD